jgi:diaminopimelate decarboxylase
MNDLIRPSLYNAYHKIEVLTDNKEKSRANLVGPICESGDFFAKNISLPKTNPGDLVVIHSAGAYGFTMSSNYNSRPRAAEVGVIDGKERVIRRRETFEDLVSPEIEYLEE